MNPKEKANQIFDKMYENQQTSAIGGNHSQYVMQEGVACF